MYPPFFILFEMQKTEIVRCAAVMVKNEISAPHRRPVIAGIAMGLKCFVCAVAA